MTKVMTKTFPLSKASKIIKGMKTPHMKQLMYMVIPILLASLKFDGNLRVLNANTVQIAINTKHGIKLSMTFKASNLQITATSVSFLICWFTTVGGSPTTHIIPSNNWTQIRPMHIKICDLELTSIGLETMVFAALKIRKMRFVFSIKGV